MYIIIRKKKKQTQTSTRYICNLNFWRERFSVKLPTMLEIVYCYIKDYWNSIYYAACEELIILTEFFVTFKHFSCVSKRITDKAKVRN